MNPYVKNSLKTTVPYKAVHRDKGVVLDANENAYEPLDALRKHMAQWVMEMPINRYPDSDTTKLRRAIATCYDVSSDQVVCGVGSDQLIDCLLRSVLESEDLVISPDPSFSMYGLTTKLSGGTFMPIPLRQDFSYDVGAMHEAIRTYQPKVTFLCNPNNPTGSTLTLEQIQSTLQLAKGIVVVDEAYIEFGGSSAIGLISDYSNLLVLRTFSKAYGLAGARVGYGIGSVAVIDAILAIKPPYHLNSFSQEIATWVIEHKAQFQPIIEHLIAQREQMMLGLSDSGYVVYPSSANFLWVETPLDIEKILAEESIYIKAFTYQSKKYYRISIGTEEQNSQLVEILKGAQDERISH